VEVLVPAAAAPFAEDVRGLFERWEAALGRYYSSTRCARVKGDSIAIDFITRLVAAAISSCTGFMRLRPPGSSNILWMECLRRWSVSRLPF